MNKIPRKELERFYRFLQHMQEQDNTQGTLTYGAAWLEGDKFKYSWTRNRLGECNEYR